MKQLWLDANAHLPMHQKALQAFIDFNNSLAGHGHAMASSVPGRAASNAIEESRTKIAELLGAHSSNQIIFTSTCTEACEWGMYILKSLLDDEIIYISPAEHPAIKQAAREYFNSRIIETNINQDGLVYFNNVNNDAVICLHLQNEIGVIEPIENINAKYLFSDMSQSAGKIQFKLSSLPVDIAVFGAHKFGGPASLGILYLKDPSWWQEFGTGSRYFNDRAGTPDAASIVASSVALLNALETLSERTQKMIEFRDILEPELINMGFEIIGLNAPRCPNTTFVSMPNGLALKLMMLLGEHGIHVGLGSACGSAYTGSSPLMKKLSRKGGPHDYMRISQWGEFASSEAQLFLDELRKCIV